MLRYEPLAIDWHAGFDSPHTESPTKKPSVAALPRYAFSSAFSVVVLFLSDICALVVACLLGYVLWAGSILHMPFGSYDRLCFLLSIFPVAYGSAGLYPGFGLGAVETIRRITYCTCVGFLMLAAGSFVFKEGAPYSRLSFLFSWSIALLTVPFFRYITLSMASSLRWWGKATVVIGTKAEASLIIRTLQNAFSLGYRVVGVVNPSVSRQDFGATIDGIPVLGGVEVAERLRIHGVRAALVWDNRDSSTTMANLQRYFSQVILVRDERTLPIEHMRIRNLGGVLGIEFTSHLCRPSNQLVKRSMDAVLGMILTLVALPLMLVSGLLVKMVSPGPMFYSQEREGLGGVRFRVLKLRTMYCDAEQRLASTLAHNSELARQWEATMKLNPDPRIVPVIGQLLRRFSIDETPQLLAIVTGRMSLVGPRPFPDYHLDRFDGPFRALRASVRPGLTGMWQVMIRSAGDLKAQELYDTFYIRNWSLWLDVYILAKTLFAVIIGDGAY